MAVDRRTRGILVDEVGGRPRWEDRLRETEGQMSISARHGTRRRNLVEKEASGRTAREVDVHVGGWHLLGCLSDDGGGHRGKSKRRIWLTRTVRRKPAKE